jgi:hypothetical protein
MQNVGRSKANRTVKCLVAVVCISVSASVHAADYAVDLGIVADLESIRPLIDDCSDLGELEDYRGKLGTVADLEELRSLLQALGIVSFHGCSLELDGQGVDRLD